MRNVKVIRKCKFCGKIFKIKPSLVKRGQGKHCSNKCRGMNKRKRIKRKCKSCGREIQVKLCDIKRGGGKYCSKFCFYKTPQSKQSRRKRSLTCRGINTGESNGMWNGGKSKNGEGYILILQHHHPYAHAYGYVLEHRIIMENAIGRFLKPTEIIHHINGIKDDNRIENLQLFPGVGEHTRFHLAHSRITPL